MWNASRLILLNSAGAEPGPSSEEPEDRWILSRLERTIATVEDQLEAYDFSHAALELYRFFWSELCDWYLEIVKPRLYEGDDAVAGNLLWVLERTLAVAHPIMPFVTEEIWSYLPERQQQLVVSPFPVAEAERIEEGIEAEVGEAIELTKALRRWRELADVAPGEVLRARADGERPAEFVGRLARFDFDLAGEQVLAAVGGVEILASPELDADAVEARLEERRGKLRSEVERGERKLGNEGFIAKAPEQVVEEERRKLAAYRAELEELSG
jgi:valyl-tRNA synthetase